MAEREGFEPSRPFGLTVFKTAAFDHSAISPKSFSYSEGTCGTYSKPVIQLKAKQMSFIQAYAHR